MGKKLSAYLLGVVTGLLNAGVWVGYSISHHKAFLEGGAVLNILTFSGICIALVNDTWD